MFQTNFFPLNVDIVGELGMLFQKDTHALSLTLILVVHCMRSIIAQVHNK